MRVPWAAVNQRDRVLTLVHRHGWNTTASQTLGSGYEYHFHGDDACVAYVDTGRAWVGAGAPIAAPEALGEVAAGFFRAAAAAGRRACLFATEERLLAAAGDAARSLQIGEQPHWDPRGWPEALRHHRSLREQLRRARAKGVRVRATSPAELEAGPLREAVERIARRWQARHAMAPMGFLVRLEPLGDPTPRTWLVAEVDGVVVGLAGVVPVPARRGWFVEHLLRDPSAPNGTSELLVDAAMRRAAEAGCAWLTLGLAPLAGDVARPLRLARRATALYDFEGLRRFKAKLSPHGWSPIHVTFPPGQSAAATILDVLTAFAPGGLLRFGLRSLLRGPDVVLGAMAALLVPWTLLLALVPARRWFGAPELRWAWVAFDVVITLALWRLIRRPTPALGSALAVAVTADALLTSIQAAVWNLPRAQGALELATIAIAWAAPTFAAVVLWGARRHRGPAWASAGP